MCTIHNIRLFNLIFASLKLIICLYVFGAGVSISQDIFIHQAFGIEFASFGGGLGVLGFMSGMIIPVHILAIKRHNRFLLLVCFLTDLLVMSLVMHVATEIGTYGVPLFDKELQLDCARRVPERPIGECEAFFNADRTSGFRLVWENLYRDRGNTVSFQTLSTLEGRECCGFFAPSNCIPNDNPFPANRPLDGIPAYQKNNRVVCGNKPTYYPEQSDCVDYFDPSVLPPIVGGCNFDMGLGFCITLDIEDESIGCASQMEDYMSEQILPHASMLLASTSMNIIAMLLSCCMFWKRKEYDVFPEFRVPAVPRKHMYHNVPEVKEVLPVEGVLKLKGFVPAGVDGLSSGMEGDESATGEGDEEEDEEDEEEEEESEA